MRQTRPELWVAPSKQFCLQPSLECRQWWQRSDIGRQTVPYTGRSHRKGTVTDSWQARRRHDECACWSERRCRRASRSATRWRSLARYDGARPLIEAAVDENCQFVVDPLTHPQPVQLPKKWRHMVVPPWWVDQPSGGVQHECGTAVIECSAIATSNLTYTIVYVNYLLQAIKLMKSTSVRKVKE